MTYNGSLNLRTELDPLVKKAYTTFKNQLSRCRNKKIKSYRDYGAKGICVEYTSREFVGWYLEKIKSFHGQVPVVGRIDHAKNYSLNNIEIIEQSDNSKEASQRTKHRTSHRCAVYLRDTQECVGHFNSLHEATIVLGDNFSTAQRIISGAVKNPRHKYIYRRI